MREFLYKNSFLRYFSAFNFGKVVGYGGAEMIAPLIAMYAVIVIATVGAISSLNFVCALILSLAIGAFTTGMFYGMAKNRTPNIVNTMPLSEKRKLCYDFLTVIVGAIIMVIMIALVFFIMGCIMTLISLIIEGPPISYDETTELDDEVVDASVKLGVYNGLFTAIYFVILYFGGFNSFSIKATKKRNIYLIVFPIVLILGTLLTSIAHTDTGVKLIMPFSSSRFIYMYLPWLSILLWGLVALAFAILSVVYAVKQHKKALTV